MGEWHPRMSLSCGRHESGAGYRDPVPDWQSPAGQHDPAGAVTPGHRPSIRIHLRTHLFGLTTYQVILVDDVKIR